MHLTAIILPPPDSHLFCYLLGGEYAEERKPKWRERESKRVREVSIYLDGTMERKELKRDTLGSLSLQS